MIIIIEEVICYVLIMLQEDKDLVHEFVQNDGLACLIKVGSEADQNYQNYILRGEFYVLPQTRSPCLLIPPPRRGLFIDRTYH